jgi:primosomal protein N' (replication factor Y) (superfamily II helicase)
MAQETDGTRSEDPSAMRRVEVALAESGRLPGSLVYSVPPELDAETHAGSCVIVPLGSRRVAGIVLGPSRGEPPRGLRALASVERGVCVPTDLLELASFAARYYAAPPAALLRALMPPALRKGQRRRVRPGGSADLPSALAEGATEPAGATRPGHTPLEERVLARLSPAGLDLAVLRNELGAGAIAAVRRLAAVGAVVVEDVEVGRRDDPVALRPAPDAATRTAEVARAPRQRAILEYVATRDPHAVLPAEIEDRFPGGRRIADALVRRGLLVTAGALDGEAGCDAVRDGRERDDDVTLNEEQAAALAAVNGAMGSFAPFLLLGVTGSGKTEVYLRAAEGTLARGSGVLLLVPEIGLTHQLVAQAHRRFGSRVAVLHSGLSEVERAAAWRDLACGRRNVAIGARSALFAPVGRLGLIVVDEEHDAAYKQEESPRYNARDLGVMRAKLAGCPVVLASATPSLESYQAALTGRYRLLELTARANRGAMPRVEVVDLRAERPSFDAAPRREGGTGDRPPPILLSTALETALIDTYRAGDQAVLFLNRRGFARFLQCESCGEVETCPDCSVSLTVHRARRAAICHHCGHARPPATLCAECRSPLTARSFGTEQVETAVRRVLPAARIARLDRDTGARPGFLRSTLAAWRAAELDVLVGTQMVAKGHDAPGVTLIGVVLADASLNFPDFRAAERTFQLLAQVSGRAGRGAKPGRVVVQTRQPENLALAAASRHDYASFAAAELSARRELGYPPFGRLTRIVLEGTAEAVERETDRLARRLRAAATAATGAGEQVTVLGPAPAAIERLRGRHRHQLLIKAGDARAMSRLLDAARLRHGDGEPPAGRGRTDPAVRIIVDVDPINML